MRVSAFCSCSGVGATCDDLDGGEEEDGSTQGHRPLSFRTNSILNFQVGKLVVVSWGTKYKLLCDGTDMMGQRR